MIFIRLEYLYKPRIFLWGRKTRPTDRQFNSFWKTRLTDRYFWRQNSLSQQLLLQVWKTRITDR